MNRLFGDNQLNVTTIIINSSHFKLTAMYLIKNLGLKVKNMYTDKVGIIRLYLHAASRGNVHALEICLTNDPAASERFPILLGATVVDENDYFSKLSSDENSFELVNLGTWKNVILFKQFQVRDYGDPAMPICILPKTNSFHDFANCYTQDKVVDWLSIDDGSISYSLTDRNSWLHRIALECKHLRFNVEYYKNLGIYVDDLFQDFGHEYYHLLTDTNISVCLLPRDELDTNNATISFSVQIDEKVLQLPIDSATGRCFSNTKVEEAELGFSSGLFYYKFELTDINMCKWHLHCNRTI